MGGESVLTTDEGPKEQYYDPNSPPAGVVVRIQMKNFMCHDNLEVKFNPRINFVCGKNGSGKSAIQTAVAVGLGGKAMATNRGSSMKSLIKNDKNSCTITVVLANRGPLAFKPREYGNYITVERHFTHTSSGYKIKSASGRVVSTEKKELDRIIAHLNIQPENPICILHQDVARNFLNSSDPKVKFKFYLKASRFDEIARLYNESALRTSSVKEGLKNKFEVVEEAFKDVMEIKKKLKIIEDVKKKETLRDQLQKEIVWAKINEKRTQLEQLQNKRELEETTRKKLEKKLEKDEEEDLKQRLSVLEEKVRELEESVREAREKLQPAREDFRNKQDKLMRTTQDCQEAKQNALKAQKQHNSCAVELDNANKNIEEINRKKEKLRREIAECESGLERVTSAEEMTRHEIQQFRDTFTKHRETLQNTNPRIVEAKRKISKAQEQFKGLTENSNSLAIYGNLMVRIIEEVQRSAKQFEKQPIGPIGQYIKVKDPKWAGAVENFLTKGFLSTFCVDNSRDAQVLGNIFKTVCRGQSSSQPPIICSKFLKEMHNIRSSETGTEQYRSLSQMLQFEHPVVANCLIDQNEVETVLLIPTNEEAYNLLDETHKVPRNCKRAFTLTGDLFYPAPNYKSYSASHQVRPASLLQTKQEDVLRQLKQEIHKYTEEKSIIEAEQSQIQQEIQKVSDAVNKNENQLRTLKNEKNKFVRKLHELREAFEQENNTDASWLATESQELLSKSEEESKKHEQLSIRCDELREATAEAKRLLETLQNTIAESDQEKDPIKREMQQLRSMMQLATNKSGLLRQKLEEVTGRLSEFDSQITELSEDIDGNTQQASQVCEPVATRRSAESIGQELKQIEQYLKKMNEEHHEDWEDLQKKLVERMESFGRVHAELNKAKALIVAKTNALRKRRSEMKKLQELLIHCARHNFQIYLNERGFEGKLEFDIEKGTLDIKVKPQRAEDIDARNVDTSSLSGGEKSFSTVCFILALWQEASLPFHFLDEFDVFMDGINRRIVMDLLIYYAKSVNRQFVFLTPLDTPATSDELVTVHKLEAPRD